MTWLYLCQIREQKYNIMDKNSKVNSGQEEQKKNNVENQPEKELNYEGNSEETSETKEDKIEEQKESTWEDKFNEMNDRYIRLYAEFDNFRRRTQKERIELMATASAGILKELIPVLDDFERAIVVNETASEIDSVKEGFSLIYNKYKGILESKGLKPMISKGEVFDSELHEAIANIPTESDEMKGKIIDDVEKGYLLHDKVVRFAKVVVGQ
jgi:molecular chaperone GrpE